VDSAGGLASRLTRTWFPLVQRPRPPCLNAQARITELRELPERAGDRNDQIIWAAETCNKAALIASDFGIRELARTLCWRQHDVFEQARPLPGSAVKLALQPILNLPRQLIREGDGDGAYTMLETLYRSARSQTDTLIAGRVVDFRNITDAPEGREIICSLTWAALLADGTRALALADRWQEAAERAGAHRGIGQRLLDGRQALIMSQICQGNRGGALALIETSTPAEQWELAVAGVLRVICLQAAGEDADQHIATMLKYALNIADNAAPTTTLFSVRLGLIALSLATGVSPDEAELRTRMISLAASDAYAARDVVTHPAIHPTLPTAESNALSSTIRTSSLGAGHIPDALYADLMQAVTLAEEKLREFLKK
jgi:hypothetical protein